MPHSGRALKRIKPPRSGVVPIILDLCQAAVGSKPEELGPKRRTVGGTKKSGADSEKVSQQKGNPNVDRLSSGVLQEKDNGANR
jgi:hypothetical protein